MTSVQGRKGPNAAHDSHITPDLVLSYRVLRVVMQAEEQQLPVPKVRILARCLPRMHILGTRLEQL